jgi:uncharacterized protein (TIGR03435 family)
MIKRNRHYLRRASFVLRSVIVVSAWVVVAQCLGAQAPVSSVRDPAFEVASIKRSRSNFGSRVAVLPGGQLNAFNASLRMLVSKAFGIQQFQVIGGPSWIASDRFEVIAKADTGASVSPADSQVMLMLRTLLAERFRLRVHAETRQLPVYALVMARRDGRFGPRLRQSDCVIERFGQRTSADDVRCGLSFPGVGRGAITMKAEGASMPEIASYLQPFVDRVVVDGTARRGRFDVELTFSQQLFEFPPSLDTTSGVERGLSIETALQEQLGLRLQARRAPVQIFVVDSAEPPTED